MQNCPFNVQLTRWERVSLRLQWLCPALLRMMTCFCVLNNFFPEGEYCYREICLKTILDFWSILRICKDVCEYPKKKSFKYSFKVTETVRSGCVLRAATWMQRSWLELRTSLLLSVRTKFACLGSYKDGIRYCKQRIESIDWILAILDVRLNTSNHCCLCIQ